MLSNDLKTTVAGYGAALAVLTQIDAHKLVTGDLSQLALCFLALCIGVLGHFTNKPSKPTT